MHLNYRHLYYFWIVAKEGHLTRAAAKIRIAQSALSSQIRELEADIGHDLFLREGRSLELTEVGRIVLGYAEGIFALGTELIASIRAGVGQKVQQLRIGAVATLSRNFQENFLRPIVKMEDVQIVLESGSLEELLGHLGVHKLHLVLSNRPVSPDSEKRWRCRRIARQPVCLVGTPRASRKQFRFPDDLTSIKIILPGPNSDIRTAFDLLCEELDIRPSIFAEVDDMAMLRLLARDSGHPALVPAVVVQDELGDKTLERYCTVPKVYENFYAISTDRKFQPEALKRIQPR